MLVNGDLEAASVQFYRQETANATSPVQLLPPADGESPSAWHEELASRIDPASEPWASLATSAAQLVAQRHRLQAATVAVRNFSRPSRRRASRNDVLKGFPARVGLSPSRDCVPNWSAFSIRESRPCCVW